LTNNNNIESKNINTASTNTITQIECSNNSFASLEPPHSELSARHWVTDNGRGGEVRDARDLATAQHEPLIEGLLTSIVL
jgi:hypothetical protein